MVTTSDYGGAVTVHDYDRSGTPVASSPASRRPSPARDIAAGKRFASVRHPDYDRTLRIPQPPKLVLPVTELDMDRECYADFDPQSPRSNGDSDFEFVHCGSSPRTPLHPIIEAVPQQERNDAWDPGSNSTSPFCADEQEFGLSLDIGQEFSVTAMIRRGELTYDLSPQGSSSRSPKQTSGSHQRLSSGYAQPNRRPDCLSPITVEREVRDPPQKQGRLARWWSELKADLASEPGPRSPRKMMRQIERDALLDTHHYCGMWAPYGNSLLYL